MPNHELNIWKTAAVFIVLGVVSISFAIYFPHANKDNESILVFSHILSHLGLGLLIIGAFSLLLELKHWTHYFQERLKEIVSEADYLKNQSPEFLSVLQTETLKAFYKDDEIAGKDSFFTFYQSNIQEMIQTPPRFNVKNYFTVLLIEDNTEFLEVYEEISWECKAIGGKIQDKISYCPDEGEYDDLQIIDVALEHPKDFVIDNLRKKVYTPDDLNIVKETGGFTMDTPKHIDGLYIKIRTRYRIPINHFIGWRMAHLTKGVALNINFPDTLKIRTEIFANPEGLNVPSFPKEGIYSLSTDNWLLPDEGIVFQFYSNTQKNQQKTVV